MKIITTNKAPKAIGPYSQAIIAKDFIFCSGQVGIDPKTGLLKDGVEEQTKQILINLKTVLESVGSSLQKVVKTTVFLKRIEDFTIMNGIYKKAFAPHKPARSTIEVSDLPKGALIEIECIATIKQ